jgi:uncharacterized protein (TIGR03032 family)
MTAENPTPEASEPQPLRSKHTSNLPALLDQLGISLFITTYQAGKLVILRSDGTALHTHFRDFSRPMGLAADRRRLAVGTAQGIHYFRNMPTVCRYLEPPDRHDACYLTRSVHITGGINIHEMAWVGDEVWFVNTRFSCLCTLDGIHSFVPRWRPSFVSSLGPDDRCHLNGLGLMDGQVRFATALAATDTPQGWRDHKKDGGVLLEVPSSTVLLRGLSMPHSPRWHGGRLWLLESGKGALGYVDATTGRYEAITELPGFTRGLDFHGPLAFVGLSQVRESAVFSGIPITERALAERSCGVWIVDLRSGETVGVLRFEDAVQEVFAVQVLPGLRWPEVGPDDPKFLTGSYDLPPEALREVPADLRDMPV